MTRRARVTPERVGIAPGTDRRVPGLRSNWTRPSVGTYSTWREPRPAVRSCGGAPAARRPSPCVPACRPHWTRSQWARRSSAMDAWTCWAQTFSAERSTTTCTPWASRPPTLPGSASSPSQRGPSTPIGTPPPTSPSPSCVPKPEAIPTTRTCTTWSVSCPRVVTPSARSGPRTTSVATVRGRRPSCTRSVGEVHLVYEGLEVTEDPGLQFLIYTAQPGTDAGERLALLGSWAASQAWAGPAPARSTSGSLASD